MRVDRPVREILRTLAAKRILGGFDLTEHYPELGEALLVCATETRTVADIERYGQCLAQGMGRSAPGVRTA